MITTDSIPFSFRLGPHFGRFNQLCEGVLDLFGTAKQVRVVKGNLYQNTAILSLDSQSKQQSWQITASKIAIWIGSLFLVPLFACAYKAITRLRYRHHLHISNPSPPTHPKPPLPKEESSVPLTIQKLNRGEIGLSDLGIENIEDAIHYLTPVKEHVKRFAVEDLDLLNTFLDGPDDQAFTQIVELFSNLECLILPNSKALTYKGFKEVQKLSKLKIFVVSDLVLDSKELEVIKDLHHLEKLGLDMCEVIDDTVFEWLPKLKNLKALQLSACCGMKFKGIEKLAALPKLESLELYDSEFDAEVLKVVATHLPKLKHLDVAFTNMDASCYPIFKAFTQLESLKILLDQDILEEQEDVPKIPYLPKMKELELGGGDTLFGYKMKLISNLTNIREIVLGDSFIMKETIDPLLKFKELRKIDFSMATFMFTEGGFQQLGEIPHLEELDLSYSNIEDFQLLQLGNCQKLKNVNVKGCEQLSMVAVKTFAQMLPNCMIDS